ncbi:MAG: MBL fold metallo-hydrolase [Anaerolineae bacterium]
MIQLGDFRVHLINEALTRNDAGGPFGLVPRALFRDYLMPDEDNLIPMAYHILFVQANGKNIVIDTGYGDKIPDKQHAFLRMDRSTGGLLGGLARLGVQPEAVDLVIDTHLHGDHAGGNTRYDANGQLVPTFPTAEYVVQRREYEDAIRPNERTRATYLAENFQSLVDSGQMRLLEGDTEITPGIRGVIAPGHTPGHMAVVLESGGQTLAFVCDLASYTIHFERLGWMTSFDVEPLITLETKRVWQKWALERDAILVFPHDPLRPIGRYKLDDKGRGVVVPIPEPYV